MKGDEIVGLRRTLGMTQVALARVAGVHAMTVSKWERGVLKPSAFALRVLRVLASVARGTPADDEARELASYLNRALIDVTEVVGMKLSASNQLKGKISQIDAGPVSSRVVIQIAPGVQICSLITTASVKRLKLGVGKSAVAIIKATEVIIGTR